MNESAPNAADNPPTVRIYCVDDHPVFLTTTIRLIQREAQFMVSGTAGSAEEAVLEVARTQPHVILLDWMLPGRSGPEMIPDLRAALPETRVIVITMLEGEENRRAALGAGADGFISKSNLYQDLIPEIHRVVAQPSLYRNDVSQPIWESKAGE